MIACLFAFLGNPEQVLAGPGDNRGGPVFLQK